MSPGNTSVRKCQAYVLKWNRVPFLCGVGHNFNFTKYAKMTPLSGCTDLCPNKHSMRVSYTPQSLANTRYTQTL